VEEELLRKFPGCRVRIVDSDAVRRRVELEKIRRDVERGEVAVVVGTQLLAHQADWPEASLVGILNPEFILNRADFRSSQRAFQMVMRMLALLGSGPEAEAVIQTEFPPHFSVSAAAKEHYAAFFEPEIDFRRLMNDPPFSEMAEIILQGANLRLLAGKARDLAALVKASGVPAEIMGPGLAATFRTGGQSRVQMTVRTENKNALDRILSGALTKMRVKKSVSILS
jgi:primosomal protein N' (replication factor Y)